MPITAGASPVDLSSSVFLGMPRRNFSFAMMAMKVYFGRINRLIF
jgi:hypothetical protein